MAGKYRKNIPRAVERALRQEAGFGCSRCGHPYLEYHHIVPYEEEEHFRVEDMIALCANCHNFFHSQGRDRQYRIKQAPKNIGDGEFRGLLQYDKRDLIFRVGGNWYENVPTILKYRDIPLIGCRLEEDQALVSINLLNSAERLVLQVVDNEVVFRLDDLWDFECRRNVAIVRSGPRNIALKLDFSTPDALIEGRLWAGQILLNLGPEHSNFGSNIFKNSRFSNSAVGIQLG